MSPTIVTSSAHTSSGHGTLRHESSSMSQQENQPIPQSSATAATPSNMESLSGFVNKPARGWLHPDHLFAKDGINYNVRVCDNYNYTYVNCFSGLVVQ